MLMVIHTSVAFWFLHPSQVYNKGQIVTREEFIQELALLVSCYITESSMSMHQVETDRHHE